MLVIIIWIMIKLKYNRGDLVYTTQYSSVSLDFSAISFFVIHVGKALVMIFFVNGPTCHDFRPDRDRTWGTGCVRRHALS